LNQNFTTWIFYNNFVGGFILPTEYCSRSTGGDIKGGAIKTGKIRDGTIQGVDIDSTTAITLGQITLSDVNATILSNGDICIGNCP